ncbi:hypothetical protein [Nocardioides pacificus]
MSAPNALVAETVASRSWHTAAGPLDAMATSVEALDRGDWVEAGLNGAASGLETLNAACDPTGALVAAGLGWAMERFSPLRDWLDDTVGDPDRIHSFAVTWGNVGGRLHADADDYMKAARTAAAPWNGLASGAYEVSTGLVALIVHGYGALTQGVGAATDVAGSLVAGVRAIVRDALSECVAYALTKIARLLTPDAPRALAEIVAKVAEWSERVSTFIRALITTMGRLGRLLDEVMDAVATLQRTLRRVVDDHQARPISQGWDFRGPAPQAPSPANAAYTAGSNAAKNHAGLDDRGD